MDKSNRELQRTRVKDYFLKAAKELIEEFGLSELSVRKIAQRAGYSYATLYNYFDDLNELIWAILEEMIQDMALHFKTALEKNSFTLLEIKELFKSYGHYYMDHPILFELFYFNRIEPPKDKQYPKGYGSFARKALEKYRRNDSSLLKASEIEDIAPILTSSIHGFLSLYFSRKASRKETMEQISHSIDYLLS